MKILLVDDSRTMRRALKSTLTHAGFTDFVEASNGAEALGLLKGVDMVLMDWNMPVMDGLACTIEIRKDPVNHDIPIIMVTTEAAKNAVITAMKHGVNDFIVKPVDHSVLLEKINSALEKSTHTQAGQRTFTLTPDINRILDRLSDELDKQGIEKRNASKVVRYSILSICGSADDKSIEAAVKNILENKDLWSKP
jgi:two-component system chemotaxis response regulator CheY